MTPSLDLIILTTQLLVWLCSWAWRLVVATLTIDRCIGLGELAILVWMLVLDKRNHQLYKEFFEQRTRWYAARGKQKALQVTEGLAQATELSDVILAETSTEAEESPQD